ncbi:type II toxin-antitoxin system VapC family toxin [Dyadobacter pollutisoli]|uniref:Type II toxin-antitoxin system VapC family toxin n=1 Tax=Dyadobacter pollutisoli TaxID=2910158 RepID=A0A9E8SJ38_9BACT|nr:type II toxin-antitoxin system VapC family toxin [Dyadobacter pollutisoli]WAC10920.1 type II toxin-antitoxin system VapC family toxin [Dyadobacter pollutisoli]
MSNSNQIFIDSSILVEFKKHSKPELLLRLLSMPDLELVINPIVLSEYTFYLLAIQGEKSPRSVKESQEIKKILSQDRPEAFLSIFKVLSNGNEIIPKYLELMGTYNLLPNDALILATCKLHGIRKLATFDVTDFTRACSAENIQLIQRVSDLKV